MKEEKNKNKNNITISKIIDFGTIVVFGMIIGFLVVRQIYNRNENSKTIDEALEEKEELQKTDAVLEINNEEVLNKIAGEWGMCLGEYNCRGLTITEDGEDKYTYTPYIMWSDGGEPGEINNIEKLEDNIYKLTIHYNGYDNEIGSSPERTVEYKVNIAGLPKELQVDENKFQKITGDREEFFKSIMN